MKITFHGAAGVVTGSCFHVETEAHRFLVDCGMFQGSKALAQRNYEPFPFDPASIDAVLLTHAHIDHSGLLPKLVRNGFAGPIYTTAPTADLLRIMLPDSAHIQESEVERLNHKRERRGEPLLTPIYTREDAYTTCERVSPVELQETLRLWDEVDVTFSGAGHVLGAAMITVAHGTGADRVRVAFTGDVGPSRQTLLKEPRPLQDVDILVMESTYGNRMRQRNENRYEALAKIVRDTLARKGNVVIPSFAVGRSQELLYGLHRLVESGELTPGQIFLDSPLAIEATEIFCSHTESFDREARHFAQETEECPLYLKELTLTRTAQESMAINRIRSGAVIISASGMCEAGRIKHHLRHNLWRPECSVVFVGYQAEGTLGRRIVRGDSPVRIHGQEVKVRAEVHSLEGFSAHADQEELVAWAAALDPKPRKVYLVHGEDPARAALKERLTKELHLSVEMPLLGEQITCTPTSVERTGAGVPSNGTNETMQLWHSVGRLHQLIDQLQRTNAEPDVRRQIAEAVEQALELAESALDD